MFLFTVFVMFFALSFMPGFQTEIAPIQQQVAEQRQAVAGAEQAVRAQVDAVVQSPLVEDRMQAHAELRAHRGVRRTGQDGAPG